MHSLPTEPAITEFSGCPFCILLVLKLRGKVSQGQDSNSEIFRGLVSSSRGELDLVMDLKL